MDETKKQKAATISGRLTGDPSFLLEEPQESEEVENQDTFRELDRLACMVEEIDREVSIVPCGAYVMASSHVVIPNNSYEGLTWERATQLSSYYHFRTPEQPERKEIVKSDGLVRPTDFLDPITSDLDGSWSIRNDNTKSTVILRNLEYPGYTFFHKPRTGVYGSAYFGDGFKNKDIAFML